MNKRNLFQLMAILMVAVVSIGFVSCGDDDDKNPSGVNQIQPGEVPSPTITDANGNVVQLRSVGGYTFNYDENGKLASFSGDGETFEIKGNSFTYSYEDDDDKTVVNVAINNYGFISAISYKYEEVDRHGEVEKEEGVANFSYNGSKQLTGFSGNGTWFETDVEDGIQVGSWSGTGSIKTTINWSNGNLISSNYQSSNYGKGSYTENGKTYTESESETETGTVTFTYGSERNGALQLPFIVGERVLQMDDFSIFGVLGLFGVGPVNLPVSYTFNETEVEIEDGEEERHEDHAAYNLKFDMNSNGTLATEYYQYEGSSYWNTKVSYGYEDTRAVGEQARKLTLSLRKMFHSHRNHQAK